MRQFSQPRRVGRHRVEVAPQRVETGAPDLAAARNPLIDFVQAGGVEAVDAALCLTACVHQARFPVSLVWA